MGTNKTVTPLVLGFFATAAATAALYVAPAFGAGHFLTGAVAGAGVAYLAFLLYMLLIPAPDGKYISFVKSYLPGAAARYIALTGAFCAMVFWLNMEPLGVLLGVFAGIMAATFFSLIKMRRTTPRSPGA
ncbi:MAG: hypothetical protein JW699_01780 [Chitinispirillaceae bacterium]|nr:hypothetical protein [Chitinispirillaceae bacterium]